MKNNLIFMTMLVLLSALANFFLDNDIYKIIIMIFIFPLFVESLIDLIKYFKK